MRYRNITVSGVVAVGTTVLAKELVERLGWRHINLGEWFRDYCRKQNLSIEETKQQADEVHVKADQELRRKLISNNKLVAEGWLAGFMAQGIPRVLKVLLVAPLEVRVSRFMQRERVGEREARALMKKRTEENIKKWRKIYGRIDFWKKDLYDVVIDTNRFNQEETVVRVMKELRDDERSDGEE